MHNDLTFITNEDGKSLKDRFATLIKDTRFFDALVGYFYSSGFYAIYPSLEDTKKIRILIGISTNRQTYEMIQKAKSHKEIGEAFGEAVKHELDESENSFRVEEGIQKFMKWLNSGKLEIKAYPNEKLHAKIYIMTFNEGDRDQGRVITGSSNFTQSGLVDNLEFNVELKSPADYHYAQDKFNKLWEQAVDVSEQYIETIRRDTWLREDITPYELYLKFLYEYFREEINEDASIDHHYRPENFKQLKYQDDAVINAKKIVEEYGGVFLSDVVGLGKTYMGTMLCQELNAKTLVLAPPHLIDETNAGSWESAFREFGFRSRQYLCRSAGNLEKIISRKEHEDCEVVLIDEAHRFRNELTQSYTVLAQICKGKKVILVTATPYNNSPEDLLTQIKLFQRTRQSTIPNLPDLEGFIKGCQRKLKGLDRKKDKDEYLAKTTENAKLIREKVLKYLMVRRTRNEIQQYYGDDLSEQGMEFPKVADPRPAYYTFNELENDVFFKTLEMATHKFKYARYTPLLYLSEGIKGTEQTAQRNMMKFMKMLVVKRLESSFFAFQQTLSRFIASYERFIEQFDAGDVYISPKHTQKIFECLESGNLEYIEQLIEDGKAERYSSDDFDEQFEADLRNDLKILKEMQKLWSKINRDPKLLAFRDMLQREEPMRNGKTIIFTESQETATYLAENIEDEFPGKVLAFTGSHSAADRDVVIANFDANAKYPSDKYSILITTDVLSEGANLHQANVVINYDIPWNPTRIMQRVGRINRVDTKHKEIFTYTFFPTDQANDEIKLRECAEAKIAAFIQLLGADAKLLTDNEEVEAHSLFSELLSRRTITGEDDNEESELRYLREIRTIRDEQPTLFEKVKRFPKKARTARSTGNEASSLVTFFRKGKLKKFFSVANDGVIVPKEVDFFAAANMLKAEPEEKRRKLDEIYFELLKKNAEMLDKTTDEMEPEFSTHRGSRDNAARLSKVLKAKQVRKFSGFTEEDEEYIERVIAELDAGGIPKKVTKVIYGKIEEAPEIIVNPLKLLGILKTTLPDDFLNASVTDHQQGKKAEKEIILSEYFNPHHK